MPTVQLLFEGSSPFTATVDSGTPVTAVDLGGSGERRRGELRLQDAKTPEITRFIFRDLEVFDLTTGAVGLDQGVAVDGILGASLLGSFAVRLSYAEGGALTFKDEIPDTDQDLASDCDAEGLLGPIGTRPSCLAVMHTVPAGGGLVVVGDETLELPATRLVVPVCLQPDAFDPTPAEELGPQHPSGVPTAAVLATGLGVSVISRSAFERLRASGARYLEAPPTTLHLPYGPESVPVIQLDRMAAVSNETIELGPCAELARRRRLLVASRQGRTADDRDRNGSSAAVVQRTVSFAVLDDTRPLIQGLRQELEPHVGDVELVLGGSFLRYFEVDLDYPARRVILQCAENQAPGACEVLPFCAAGENPRCPDKTQQ